jgi:hypothetical protein
MLNKKCFIIPVGATGLVIKRPKKSEKNTREALKRFSTTNRCTRDIGHNKKKYYNLQLEA